MWRLIALVFAVVFVLAPAVAMAKSGYVRPPEVVRAGLPTLSLPQLTPNQVLNGCGKGRFRDPKTQTCRGPADFGN